MFLEGKQGEVRLADGNIKLKGRRYSMQDRSYSIEWERAPQPVALHLNCLRAVRDKLPRGSYVMHVSLYDHLAGNALQWSKLEHERWNDVTSVVEHGGDHRDVEISLDQSLRLVLPSQVPWAQALYDSCCADVDVDADADSASTSSFDVRRRWRSAPFSLRRRFIE